MQRPGARAHPSDAPPGLVEESIAVGPLSLVLRRPLDVERLIDEERFAADEFLPYWAELWPSGVALARHVARLDIRGARVLELGCGLGLPALAAAAAGASVHATDWSEEAVALVRHNAAANAVALRASVLAWGDERSRGLGAFELVLAADVLYEERNAAPLLVLLDRVVADGGEALVADPGRRHATAFLDLLPGAGWSVERIAAAEIPSGAIYRLRRATP